MQRRLSVSVEETEHISHIAKNRRKSFSSFNLSPFTPRNSQNIEFEQLLTIDTHINEIILTLSKYGPQSDKLETAITKMVKYIYKDEKLVERVFQLLKEKIDDFLSIEGNLIKMRQLVSPTSSSASSSTSDTPSLSTSDTPSVPLNTPSSSSDTSLDSARSNISIVSPTNITRPFSATTPKAYNTKKNGNLESSLIKSILKSPRNGNINGGSGINSSNLPSIITPNLPSITPNLSSIVSTSDQISAINSKKPPLSPVTSVQSLPIINKKDILPPPKYIITPPIGK